MLKQYLPDFIFNILGFISKYQIFGFIPLNATLHLLISTTIAIYLLKKKFKPIKVFIIILMLGILKELFDSNALGNTWQKHIRDMCINLIFPTLVLIVEYIKNKAKVKTESPD
jgi:hypothetical protein